MRFVFIDSRINDIPNIISAFESDINYYVFDFYNDTFSDLKDKLTNDYESIGIIQHNTYSSTYKLLENSNDSVVENVTENDAELQTWSDYIDFLKWMYTNKNVVTIDLFACDLWDDSNWKYVIENVQLKNNIHIRASLNITGTGGNFILESDNFDTIGTYFTEDILQYKYAFGFQTYTGFEPYGNRYFEPYILPDGNPGTLTTNFATSTAIKFPTLSSSISNVKFVVSNGNAAVIRLTTGNAIILGTTANGGNPSQTIKNVLNSSTNVVKIVCNDTAFCAIYTVSNDSRKRVVHWGYYGASDIETIGTGNANFKNISTVQASLDLVDIIDIDINSSGAFAALSTSGVVYAWGDKATGGDPSNSTNISGTTGNPSLATLLSGTDATFGVCSRLICGQKHFGVISSNRYGTVWGNKISATSGGFIYNTSVTGVDDILLATDNLQNCIFLRIPESVNPFSVSVSNINTSGTVNTQSLFTGVTAKSRYIIQRMGIGRTASLITNTLSEYLWVYLDDGLRLISFGITTGQVFQTLTNDSTGLNYSNVSLFAATPSVITFRTTTGYKTFATQVDANVTNSIANIKDIEESLSLSIQPTLYYTFETSTKSGNTITNIGSSGTNFNLTLYNQANISSSIFKYGTSSLDLSGTTYFSSVGPSSFQTTPGFQYANLNSTLTITSGSNFSVSFWFYISNRGSGYPMIFHANDSYPGRIYVGLNPSGTNKLLIGCQGTPGLSQELFGGNIQTTNLELNTWHYIGWSVNGNTWTIRLNGGTSTLTGMTAPITNSFPYTSFAAELGSAGGSRHFNGYVDNFRFFNGSLTATDLTNLYNEPFDITGGVGFLKYNLNRELKLKPSSNTINVYGSGTAGTTALTEIYTNAVEAYTSSNAYAISQTSPSQYTLVEAITNANLKTTVAKQANTNVYFGPSGKGLFALEIPLNPAVSPSTLTINRSSTLSYYVSNPDLAAERWAKYALSTSNTSVVPIGSQYSTYDNISHTYIFNDVSFSTLGIKTLYIWSIVSDLCYNVLSFTVPIVDVEYPCFKEGSKILRMNPETDEEEYVPIECLCEGDLIKTYQSGYKAIFHIGRKTIENPVDDTDKRNRLYVFKKSNIPWMTEDLCITGEHCTLHRKLSHEFEENVIKHMGDIYITEYQYRVPACIDERAVPYEGTGPATIWHFALENHNIYHNYGVYANGLLVESCSIQYLTELSNMEFV